MFMDFSGSMWKQLAIKSLFKFNVNARIESIIYFAPTLFSASMFAKFQ